MRPDIKLIDTKKITAVNLVPRVSPLSSPPPPPPPPPPPGAREERGGERRYPGNEVVPQLSLCTQKLDLSSCETKPKKIRLVRDSNPWPLRYRGSAVIAWANKTTATVCNIPVEDKDERVNMWNYVFELRNKDTDTNPHKDRSQLDCFLGRVLLGLFRNMISRNRRHSCSFASYSVFGMNGISFRHEYSVFKMNEHSFGNWNSVYSVIPKPE